MGSKLWGNVRNAFTAFCLVVCLASSGVLAAGGHFHYHGGGGGRYFHGGGGWGWGARSYQTHWFGYHHWGPRLGGFYWGLPLGCSALYVGGLPYYYYDGFYFEPYGAGYIVVNDPTPAAVQAPAASAPTTATAAPATTAAGDEVTVNVPNSNGTFTAVKLNKHGKGYVGPQGEFYSGHPTVAQLKTLYGN